MVSGMEYDYLSVDDLISVIVNPDFGTGTPQQINNVCRGVVTIQEAAKSRGAVQAGDTMFLISEKEMDTSLPEIGAIINPLDEEDVWYTVLRVMKDRDSKMWHCMARDLKVALNLGQTADQERREEVQTGSGSTEFTWTPIASDLPTRLQPISANLKEEYGAEELDVSHVLYFANTLDTSDHDRFIVDGNYYYVKGWKQADMLGEPFVVMVDKGAETGVPFRSVRSSGSRKSNSRGSGKSHSRSRRSKGS